jgi:hypothetical protein
VAVGVSAAVTLPAALAGNHFNVNLAVYIKPAGMFVVFLTDML